MKVDTKHDHETWWDKVQDGFGRLRQSAAGALTRFRPAESTRLPAERDIDLPRSLSMPGWGLIGGEVFEDDHRVVVRLELPGMDRKDFDVSVQDGALVVRGEKRFEQESGEGRWRLVERAYGHFHRRVPLPAAVEADRCRAVYKDGVLKVELPKDESAKPRRIAVRID